LTEPGQPRTCCHPIYTHNVGPTLYTLDIIVLLEGLIVSRVVPIPTFYAKLIPDIICPVLPIANQYPIVGLCKLHCMVYNVLKVLLAKSNAIYEVTQIKTANQTSGLGLQPSLFTFVVTTITTAFQLW